MTNFESLDELTQTVIKYRDLYQRLVDDMAQLKEYELLIKNSLKAGEDIPDVGGVTITVVPPRNPRVSWDPAPTVRIKVDT